MDDFDHCYRAVQSRDPRFDGWFFTAVTSTGVYCRPSCPALTPKRENVCFFPTAAAAQRAGFRACLRCRPDAAPGSPAWLGRADVASRALKLVLDGFVDREGVSGLAAHLGYSERQLHRVLLAEVGTGALALARAQRAQTARVLIENSDLPMAQVTFAAGFASVRQFNDTVRAIFGRTPSELRAAAKRGAGSPGRQPPSAPAVVVRLAYRRPFDGEALFGFLSLRAVSGLEEGDEHGHTRSLRLAHGNGAVELKPEDGYLEARFFLSDLRDLTSAIARCRHLANLDADPQAVDRALGEDPVLAPLVDAGPGMRVPGSVDGFETAVRAVAGQQVSVAGARRLVAGLVARCGGDSVPGHPELRAFPSPCALADVLEAGDASVGLPGPRRRALLVLCRAVSSGEVVIDNGMDPGQLGAVLQGLPGIGPWTAQYVVMRALGHPDAFLASDLGTRRGAQRLGLSDEPGTLARRAERWRPWRAYAQMHLWSAAAQAGSPAATGRTRRESRTGRKSRSQRKEHAA